jgi:hypothetical protein
VFYDDFGDCYDEIAIAGVDFISEQPIWSLYLQGGGMLLRGQRLWVIDLIVDGRERKSRSRGDESASYVVPDDATADVLSAI